MSDNSFFVYTAQQGESIGELAQRFGCDKAALVDANSGAEALLSEGCRVKIPGRGCPNGAFYRLGRAESPAAAAARFGISLGRLLEANPFLSPEEFAPGQVIVIPMPHFRGAEICTYEVGARDRLFDVLRRFDMSVSQLRLLNPGTDIFALRQGDRLNVREPEPRPGSRNRELAEGETLYSLARELGCEVTELLRLNQNLRPADFCPGARIRIP